MDHLDKRRQNLEVLGVNSLRDFSLLELSKAVKEKFPAEVSKERILNVYVLWLHQELADFDVSVEGAVRDRISAWYRFLLQKVERDHLIIAGAFEEWQRNQIRIDPECSMRLGIMAAELRNILPVGTLRSDKSPVVMAEEGKYGHMHPDRVILSQAGRAHGGSGDEENGAKPDNSGGVAQKEQDLSFLTGSNRLVLEDMASPHLAKEDDNCVVINAKPKTAPLTPRSMSFKGSPSKTSSRSKSNYVCARCGVPGKCCLGTPNGIVAHDDEGHLIQECPTNLIPEFDRKPPKNYKCKICRKTADHYCQLCPKNKDPDSVTQRRRRAMESLRGGREHSPPDHGRNRHSGSSPLRSWDRWPNPFHDQSRARSRSRSPDYRTRSRRLDGLSIREYHTDGMRTRYRDRFPGPETSSELNYDDVVPVENKDRTLDPKAQTKGSKKVVFANGFVNSRGKQEGRLSYYDEYDEEVSMAEVKGRTGRLSRDDGIDGDSVEAPDLVPDSAAEDFQDALREMIVTESAKADLLVFVDGVERITKNGAVTELFGGREGIFANPKASRLSNRPCFADLSGFSAEEERTARELIEADIKALLSIPEEHEQLGAGVDDRELGLAKEDVGAAEVATHGADATMVDVEPAAPVSGPAEEVQSMTIATGALEISEPLCHGTRKTTVGSDATANAVVLSDGPQTMGEVFEPTQAVSGEVETAKDPEKNGAEIDSSTHERIGSETFELHEPVGDADMMEVEASSTVGPDSPRPEVTDIDANLSVAREDGFDSEMTGVEASEPGKVHAVSGESTEETLVPERSLIVEDGDGSTS
ncbi:hypothetical protein VTK26DRAFT_4507 [Humicola hyalothermophila]